MRIYMQALIGDSNTPRFYHLWLQEDLIDGWNVTREWGVQGGTGRLRQDHYLDMQEGLEALLKLRDAQLKRGYRVVFSEGQQPG